MTSNSNYKGLLQEWCQSHEINLPIYTTFKVKNCKQHEMKWKGTCYLDYQNITCHSKIECCKKIDAEQHVAQLVYNKLIIISNDEKNKNKEIKQVSALPFPSPSPLPPPPPPPPPSPSPSPTHSHSPQNVYCPLPQHKQCKYDHVHVLIDLENQQPNPTFISDLKIRYQDKIDIRGFKSSFSSVMTNKYDPNHIMIHTLYSNANDAADHYMTFTTGQICALYSDTSTHNQICFILLSRDKFSKILHDILTSLHFKVYHFMNCYDFEHNLQNVLS